MNKKLKTTLEFTKNLFTTGAFSETSREVEIEICRHISDKPNQVIVEYGMGHGNLTREILNKIAPTSKVYSQVLYTKFNFKKFLKVYDNCELKKLKNIPTEYIYHCQKKMK